MRVLVAEDHHHVRKQLVSMLTGLGLEVVSEHADGRSALDWIKANHGQVDGLFLDIKMPRMTGIEVAEAANLPTVLVTGYDDQGVRAFEAPGICDYILKPLEASRLETAVAKMRKRVNRKRQGPTIRVGASHDNLDLPISMVAYFENIGDHQIEAWCNETTSFNVLGFRSLAEIEDAFPQVTWTRPRRDILVNGDLLKI